MKRLFFFPHFFENILCYRIRQFCLFPTKNFLFFAKKIVCFCLRAHFFDSKNFHHKLFYLQLARIAIELGLVSFAEKLYKINERYTHLVKLYCGKL